MSLCVEGCVVGGCLCFTPAFVCNPNAGRCIEGLCDGACEMAPWLIAICVILGLLLLAGFIACGRACCCPDCCRRQTTVQHIYHTVPSVSREHVSEHSHRHGTEEKQALVNSAE